MTLDTRSRGYGPVYGPPPAYPGRPSRQPGSSDQGGGGTGGFSPGGGSGNSPIKKPNLQ